MNYQRHVEELADEMGCRLVQKPALKPMMYVEFGYVEGPTITNQIDYLAILHELGHFHHGHTQGRPPKQAEKYYFTNGVLKSEAQAWNWAIDRCLETVTPASWQIILWCFESYLNMARLMGDRPYRITDDGNRHHVEFVFDKPDNYIYDTVRRMRGD